MNGRADDAPAVHLDDRQRLASLRLIRSENVGPATFAALVRRFGSPQAALDALPDLAGGGASRRTIRIASREDAEAEIERAGRLGARFICRGESDYPVHLAHAEGAPPVIALMGSPQALARPTVAVVGSRNASAAGSKFCADICRDLGQAGYVVVSGLARGIDTAAHKASLLTGTIGVFAGGLDRPYPEENKPLMRAIADGNGALVSEMPFGWTPRANDFPRRNRVIAGLASGLLVVEAALRSGSLISARYAGELGRLVFAVPGSPLDPRAAGTNQLLKDGAILVTEAADVATALAPLDPRMTGQIRELREDAVDIEIEFLPVSRDDRSTVLAALGPVPILVDDLVEHTGAPSQMVQTILLELDLAGCLERHPGGRVSLLPPA